MRVAYVSGVDVDPQLRAKVWRAIAVFALIVIPLFWLMVGKALANDWSSGWPPDDCPTSGGVQLIFLTPEAVERICGNGNVGCFNTRTRTIIAPDPRYVDAREFKRILSHELCHLNGGDHPKRLASK